MLKSCKIFACANGMLGLHLSRAPWDPYPWVSGVQKESNAYRASLRVGDTVLELNGHDILGQKISEIAEQISMHWQNGNSFVTMTIWRSANETVEGEETEGENQSIINQQSLQKFANCLQNIAQLLECPVCLEVIKPPGWQCCNGHVLCTNCRSRSEKCPVCRVPLGPRGRCLLSDKLFTLLAESFPCDGVRNMKNALKKQHKCTTEFLSTNTTIARERREAKAIRKKVKSLCAANDETSVTTAANPEQAGAVIRWHVEKDYTAGTETVDKNSVDCLHKKMHAAKVLHTPLKTQVDVSEMNKEENSAAILGYMRRTCNKQSTMEKISMSQCSNTYSNNCHNRNNNDNATKLKEVEKVESEESVENIVTNVKLNCCCCCCSFSCNHNAVHDTGNQDEQKMINNNSQNKNNCNNMLVKLKLKSSEKTNVVDAVVSSGSCCCCSSCCHSMSMRSPEKITRSAQSHEQQQQQIRAK